MNGQRVYALGLLSIAVSSVLWGTGRLRAQEGSLQIEVEQLAEDVKKALAGKETALAVGSFTTSSRLPASAGPVLTLSLRRELAIRKITVRDDARLRLEGKYGDVIDKESQKLAVNLSAKIVEQQTGQPVKGFSFKPRGIFGDASLAALLGVSMELAPDLSSKDRDEILKVAIDRPNVQLHKAFYRQGEPPALVQASSPHSKLRMEIWVKAAADKDYLPRRLEVREGEAFVPIEREEVYEVRLVNDNDFEIAVQLTIDGLSLFAFADGMNPKTRQPFHSVIISPKSRAKVTGWYRNEKEANAFLVTEYARSAAKELNCTTTVGSITASYCASWPVGEKPPEDEPKVPVRYAKSAEATARGLLIQKQSEVVERTLGVVRGSVTVRYAK